MSKASWLITPKMLFLKLKGENRQISMKKADPLFKDVLRFLQHGKEESAINLLFPAKKIEIEKATDYQFKIDGAGNVFIKGEARPVHRIIAEKLKGFVKDKLPYTSLINFSKNLNKNPSVASQEQLHGFLTKYHHPITENGYFLAYKYVTNKDGRFVDSHSQTFANDIGNRVKMDRSKVDADPNVHCSTGLHVAAFPYVANNDTILLVMVNPKDVVSVPTDYQFQKMRCCEYTVIGVVKEEIKNTYVPNSQIVNIIKSSLKSNPGFSFDVMTGKEIVNLVEAATGIKIPFNFRSKRSIVKRATEIFTKKGLLANTEPEKEPETAPIAIVNDPDIGDDGDDYKDEDWLDDDIFEDRG